MHQLLAGYDHETLAQWYVALNSYRWPEGCPLPQPAGWASGTEDERRRLARPLWKYCVVRCTDAELSRAWWLYGLGRSEAAWHAWWDDPAQGAWGKAANAHLRQALREEDAPVAEEEDPPVSPDEE